MQYFYFLLLVFSVKAIQQSKHSDLENNGISSLHTTRADKEETTVAKSMRHFQNKKQKRENDKTATQNKPSVLKNVRKQGELLNIGRDMPSSSLLETLNKRIGTHYFRMDPLFSELRRKTLKTRRKHKSSTEDSEEGTTAELELRYWLDEWDEHWLNKKFEALNSTEPRGDVVNMVAARPWGIPCGDPNQHDLPWGSCVLPMECDADLRIYRGDSFCGRNTYICCAVQLTHYDMYQGLDVSFEATSVSTDSGEKKKKNMDSKEERRRKRIAETKNRKRDRKKRKKRMMKSIKNILEEIRNILNTAYRNGTAQRKKKTEQLKKFIQIMKKQYRKDRKALVNLHESDMTKMDEKLQATLNRIRGMNQAFIKNDTFRDIVVNGTVNKDKLTGLLRMHPELERYFKNRRMGGLDLEIEPAPKKREPETERLELEDEEPEPEKKNTKVLNYDLEYGMLYF